VLDIELLLGQELANQQLTRCMDLSLQRSGENFTVKDLVEVARWGHFSSGDFPWERFERI
jgi:hypothetical protein